MPGPRLYHQHQAGTQADAPDGPDGDLSKEEAHLLRAKVI